MIKHYETFYTYRKIIINNKSYNFSIVTTDDLFYIAAQYYSYII